MATTKVTNTAAGPRGVAVALGKDAEGKLRHDTHWLEPNETAELELHPDHDLYEGVEKGESAAKKAARAAEAAGDMQEAVGGKDQ
jgi:hypothetical protein